MRCDTLLVRPNLYYPLSLDTTLFAKENDKLQIFK